MGRDDFTIGLGTIGSGVWISYNGGGKWRQIQGPMDNEGNVRAFSVNPHRAGSIACTVDRDGVYVSNDNGGSWEPTGARLEGDLWSITHDPHDENRIFVGARPGVLRSTDGGGSFETLSTSIEPRCLIGVPRTTNVVVDPTNADIVWASVEINGLHRSLDGGDSWASLGQLGGSDFHNDVHGFAIRDTGDGSELIVSTPFGLARSDDDGVSWDWHEFAQFPGAKFEFAYSRCVRTPWNDGTVLVCVGDGIPGSTGALEVSRDGGATWRRVGLPGSTNSTMYWLATHEELPGVIVASSVFGQVYLSTDHAETWTKLDRELGQIRGSYITPV
ncbi:MAG: photosystem II stability/assembly factor-like uncharacterized protein [Candidatus Poriferisodalaceae bacterium]|jgi:photosystem II stability/assembly factor-like uncharacterized protein